MNKFLLLLFFSIFFSFGTEKSHTVLVSIAPYKHFVEKIGEDSVKVALLVPPGASPHYYEATAKQILAAGKADVWFKVGESFEVRAETPLKNSNPQMSIVDLREGIDLIYEGHGHCGHEGCGDPHVWMSPRLLQKQVISIRDALIKVYPENKAQYEERTEVVLKQLQDLDKKLTEIFSQFSNKNILVSHPAYSYFARDYGINQFSVEFEGREPSPKQVSEVIRLAKERNIKTIFVQTQHSSKGARLIADQIGAKVVELDPLSENYIENMYTIGNKFAESMGK